MGNIRIAVCDDEKEIREDLARQVREALPSAKVCLFPSGEALLLDAHHYDIVLLDIEMPGGNGLEIAREIRKRSRESAIIFVTGYEAYMPEAFDVRAFHYLLKPVREEKLREVLSRAVQEADRDKAEERRYILLKSGGLSQKFFLDEITYLESNNKKIILHLADGTRLERYGKMNEMEQLLGTGFYRCHRCFLVNMSHIISYSADEIVVTGHQSLLLTQRKYADFVRGYLRYIRAGGAYVDT